MQVSIDDLKDLKYLIVEQLVADGIIEDCTDNDKEVEVDTENAISEVFEQFFKISMD